MLRRTCLLSSFLAALSPLGAFAKDKIGIKPESVPPHPDYPRMRAGTQLDHLYESMLVNGFAVKNPNIKPNAPTVVIVSDTQCPWCSKLWNATLPLQKDVNFEWYFVPVLRDLSIDQGALILSRKNPWEALAEHEAHFKDADFRGLNPKGIDVDKKFRDEVWTNAKIARWSGVTSVPFGVFKTEKGAYIPIFSGTDTETLKTIIFGK